MNYQTLGSTGTKVSELCFGTWRFGLEAEDGTVETTREEAHDLLDAAWDYGINFIDTANGYGGGQSERWIGEWLDDYERENVVIASKVYWTMESQFDENLSRKNVRAEIEGTLNRLNTDYIDLYYIHRWDDETPIRETLRTLTCLIEEGKVNYLGASSMAAWKLTKALWTSDVDGLERFEVTQPRFNAAYRDPVREFLDVCTDQNLAVCPYSPLEGGFLTGKYDRDADAPEGSRGDLHSWEGFSEEQWAVLDEIQSVADDLDATPAQVSLRWLSQQESFSCIPIVGARTTEQLTDNAGAAKIELSSDQYERIESAYED
ncbi:aldo/keto reductase [Haladaptatus pallidirubidus]|uniref:Aldo/keto reductase n=1 Tax=Haladaptatus pallidirubidus TaxID=1008152 RepID=A0AAV3UPH3_9EURY|nr:aldo/keto reductase [Haladaptatus pallidirubidus]